MWGWLLCLAAAVLAADGAGAGAARLVCYVENARASDSFTECTHLVYAGDARGEKLDAILKEYRKNNPKLKILLRVAEVDKDFRSWMKSKHVQGLEIHDVHKSLNKTKILETVEAARSALSSSGGGPLFLALPSNPELLAKYYDLRTLVKKVDYMMVQTHALGVVKKMTYHPSRLSGLWDMLNTDSVVDLVVGLGVPASKVVISLPATARKFDLLNETLSTPGSPTTEDDPKEIDQAELCRLLQKGRWTLERDQDLSAPYAFKNTTWISFEDASSVDVKGKYARVRGLAGLALHKANYDVETPCGPSLKASLTKVLNQQSRAPRAAILRSLEHEILSAPGHARALDALQVSPYRITQVVDSDGVIHSIREDTRTEFTCSRQGYFVHPRSCARFYRCVKFDQLSPEYTVFEFDCPAGLAFDSRYEVCVWPGSLPHSQACPGSSEIAPVPQTRFVCPDQEGYYADPENCRWFFACLDHGTHPLSAYEFRCPFGLGFDAARLKCDWPWLVPACGHIARYEAEAHGFSSAILTGAAGFQGQTAAAVNVAAHQSLVSGASLNNLVGIQNGFLSNADALDSNFIASQELSNGQYSSGGHNYDNGYDVNSYQISTGQSNLGLAQATKYNDEGKYTSGSIILDDYRLPTKSKGYNGQTQNIDQSNLYQSFGQYNSGNSGSYVTVGKGQYETVNSYDDNSGAYVHDPSGDYAEPYRHEDSPAVPYVPDDSGYKQSGDYYDYNRQSGSLQNYRQYTGEYNGQYVHDNSGAYLDSDSTKGENKDYSGSYIDHSGSYNQDNSGKYVAGIYRAEGYIGNSELGVSNSDAKAKSEGNIKQYHGAYSAANSGNYLSDSKAFTGVSHTLTAGAVNVGLVGKTTLVDAAYTDQGSYQTNNGYNYGSTISHGSSQQAAHPGHISYIAQPAVSIHHLGTDANNLDGYGFVTTPTSSGIPTTATPFAVTTALPIATYKTTFVPEPPKTSIKQIFGFTQPAVTYVKPTVVAVKQQYVTPKVEITDYNQAINSNNAYAQISGQLSGKSESSGYNYDKPSIQFEEGVTYTTPAPVVSVSTYKPQGFSHSQQTLHKVESVGFDYATATPVNEPKFKKLVAYTTGATLNVQPEVASVPQSFSHQTIHKVENSKPYNGVVESDTVAKIGIASEQPQQVFEYTTAQPAVVSSTYQPQVYSQQTVHQVDFNKVNTHSQAFDSSYQYKKPDLSGYKYEAPQIKLEEAPKTIFAYSTPAPVISTYKYKPQSYSSQTLHNVETQSYVPVTPVSGVKITYQPPTVTSYENPILKYTQKITPTYVRNVKQNYEPLSYSHQTIHNTVKNAVYTPPVDLGSTSYESSGTYEVPQTNIQYTTAQPALALESVSTYQPQVISHQTLHDVDGTKINTYSQGESGYEYQKPVVRYQEGPEKIIQISTPAPIVSSTYRPQAYSHQTIHKVESQKFVPVSTTGTPSIALSYQNPAVSVYENPFLKYSQKETYVKVTPTTYNEKYQPIAHQHEITHISQPVQYESSAQQSYSNQNIQFGQEGYSYNQPEIQRGEELSSGKSYSDASVVSHQVYHQSNVKPEKDIVFISTSPSTLAYEDHYAEYEKPKRAEYKAPEYIPPAIHNQQSYSVGSTVSTPVDQSSFIHQNQDNSDYKSFGYSQQYETVPNAPAQKYSFSTSHESQPRKGSVHLSSVPGSTVVIKYKQVAQDTPQLQKIYKAEEYLPPVVSTSAPSVSSTYRPSTYATASTTREYLPPISVTKYNTKDTIYSSSSTTQEPTHKYYDLNTQYKAPDYLPPLEDNVSGLVHYENFDLKNSKQISNLEYNPFQEYNGQEQVVISSTYAPIQRQQNIVVQNAKSNLLGFGTVGPDAGLVSTVSYTTPAPVSSSTYRPALKSTTSSPTYNYVESTTQYKAPEYLPPLRDSENLEYKNYNEGSHIRNPYQSASYGSYQRKQNIVVETAKSHLLGFGTVGPDAGLISPVTYSTSAPVIVSSDIYSSTPKVVTTPSYKQELISINKVTPSSAVRRTKPKVAVVTKINDFNPLLVRKLGAICSCQSPVLVLKGKRPNVQTQDFDDYSNDYEDDGRGDIKDSEWTRKSARLQNSKTVTTTPVVTSTFNPIIVPDDSYYQDFQEAVNYGSATLSPKEIYAENFVSNAPVVVSTTEKVVRIRPRVKAITVAPTYRTVLLNQEVAPTVGVKQSKLEASTVDSQAFDRYGPGGWRSRDETLQGSVDCQRAGLFRHPKQCNKFYACRWDCTKQRFTLHVFNCPVQLSFDETLGACNWPSQGPACQGNTLLTNTL